MKTRAIQAALFTFIGGALFVYGARGQAGPPGASDAARHGRPPPPLVCSAAASPFIDDLEDGNASTLDGFGVWYVFDDEESPSSLDLASLIAPGGFGRSRFAARIAGSSFRLYAGMGVALGCARDVSAFEGYRFAVKAGGPHSFDTKVPTAATVLVENGGACTIGCDDHFSERVTLTDAGWHECSVRFRDLAQQGFGDPVAFDARKVMGMEFIASAADQPFDITVDNVELAADIAQTRCVPIARPRPEGHGHGRR